MSKVASLSIENKKTVIRQLCKILGRELPANVATETALDETIKELARAYRALLDGSDPVAIKVTAVYFGLPKYGHKNCWKIIRNDIEIVTQAEPDIEKKYCILCDKKLIPEVQPDAQTP